MIKRPAYTFGLSEWERMESFLKENNYSLNKEKESVTIVSDEKPKTVGYIRYGKVMGVDCVDLITSEEGLEKVIADFSGM